MFDIDTQVFPEYFSRLTYVFLKAENRTHAIYQPIPFFTNNVYEAPMLARVVAFSHDVLADDAAVAAGAADVVLVAVHSS